MAQIRTINGERYNVNETREEINTAIRSLEAQETGIIELNLQVEIHGFLDGQESIRNQYEPVTFIVKNIMMYY